ncbi:hypothetical protein EB796_011748 [Bugula neritina]|uniref:Uncharacterized protein n=1 Tax=Bugula neritina TaxID=10212 RepID=A0A7J7JUA3_BUGNE|nr:hypothetical protein EB796_011748 [Bugula neritina]
MTLAELEKFVTGPAIYKSSSSCSLMQSPPQQQVSVGQKRKPDETLTGNVAQFVDNSNLFHLTLSKIFTPPPKRTEPPLLRCMFLRRLMKQLQYGVSPQTPCKKISLDLSLSEEDTMPSSPHPSYSPESARELYIPAPLSSSSLPHLAQRTITPDTTGYATCFDYAAKETPSAVTFTSEVVDTLSMDGCQATDNIISAPTEMIDHNMIPSFENMDFHSLVQCSVEQLNCKEEHSSKLNHADELDSIMQV